MNTEKLRQENRFIRLRNDGKTMDEIAVMMPSVSKEDMEIWEKELQSEYDKAPNIKELKSQIIEKTPEGKYIRENTLNFHIGILDGILFQLWQLSSPRKDSDKEFSTEQKEFILRAKESHDILQKHVISIDKIQRSYINDQKTISFIFKANTEEIAVKQKIESALKFYGEIMKYNNIQEESKLIKEPSPDSYQSIDSTFPIALKQFQIQNYLGIKKVGIGNIPIDTPWIFITGENGYGKSTLLQAITIGLYGRKDGDIERLQNKDAFISVEFKNGNANIINNIQDRIEHLEKMACYGPSRLLIQTDRTQNEIGDRSAVTYGLFKSDGVLLNIEYELLLWHLDKDTRFDKVRDLFLTMIPYLHDIKVKDKRNLVYIEKEPHEKGEQYDALPFEKLASGFKSFIAMVGDMIVRLMKSQPHIEDPSELEGIVIIDELDLHWHPKLQRELPTLLSKAFPHVQFIATTHSVIPILGAPKNSAFLKVNRTKEEGITVQQLDLNIENLLPNILLTSPLFDMDQITAVTNQNIADVRTEDNAKEMEDNLSIEKQLEAFEASNRQFPDDLFKPQASR